MIVHAAGSFTVGWSQTAPSMLTPGGRLSGTLRNTPASAGPIVFSQVHGAASTGKWAANAARLGGSVKKSAACIAATLSIPARRLKPGVSRRYTAWNTSDVFVPPNP